LVFLAHDRSKLILTAVRRCRILRQEYQPGSVAPGRRKRETQVAAFAAEKGMRDLDQDTGAITGIFLAAAGPAMHKVPEDGERVGNDAMRTSALDVHDKTDATGIVFKSRVIQTLLPCVMCRFQFNSPFPTSLVSIATSICPAIADQPFLFLAPVSEIWPRPGKFILLLGKSAKKH